MEAVWKRDVNRAYRRGREGGFDRRERSRYLEFAPGVLNPARVGVADEKVYTINPRIRAGMLEPYAESHNADPYPIVAHDVAAERVLVI
jgi:hypothetical protein